MIITFTTTIKKKRKCECENRYLENLHALLSRQLTDQSSNKPLNQNFSLAKNGLNIMLINLYPLEEVST